MRGIFVKFYNSKTTERRSKTERKKQAIKLKRASHKLKSHDVEQSTIVQRKENPKTSRKRERERESNGSERENNGSESDQLVQRGSKKLKHRGRWK